MKNLSLLGVVLFSFNLFASEKSLYEFKWLDDDEKVYVIQNKEYIKSKRFELDFSIADSNSSPYQDTLGMILGVNYYFNENWGVTFRYKSYQNDNNSELEALLDYQPTQVKPLIRKIDAVKMVYLNWLPFYGKINTFNKIVFFDLGLSFGLGQFDTQGNYKTFLQTNKKLTFESETDMGIGIRSYLKFFLEDQITVGVEYELSGVDTIKSTDGASEFVFFTDLSVHIGYIF